MQQRRCAYVLKAADQQRVAIRYTWFYDYIYGPDAVCVLTMIVTLIQLLYVLLGIMIFVLKYKNVNTSVIQIQCFSLSCQKG